MTVNQVEERRTGSVGKPDLLAHFLSASGRIKDEDFATVRTAALELGVDRRTVRRWIEQGTVAAIYVGGRYWIARSSLMTYLRRQSNR